MDGFAKRLRRVMIYRQIRPQTLAREAGINYATVGRFLAGKTEPTAFNLCSISTILGVDPIWLLIGRSNPNETKDVVT